MISSSIKLSDGTIIRSGVHEKTALVSVDIHESCNTGSDLTLGSVCATEVTVTLINPEGSLSIVAGDEFKLYKENTQIGIFKAENVERTSPNKLSITGYDRVVKLDKDLSEWLETLTGWPYTLAEFASLVCEKCGLSFSSTNLVNKDYLIDKFSSKEVTGRQLIQWLCEIGCCYAVASPAGVITPSWYTELTTHNIGYMEDVIASVKVIGKDLHFSGVEVSTRVDNKGNISVESDHIEVTDDGAGNVSIVTNVPKTSYYYQNSLKYTDYVTEPIEAVQIRLGEGDNAYLWPVCADDTNSYIISDNPLIKATTNEVSEALQNILNRIKTLSYTPCSVTIPETLEIKLGSIVEVIDKNAKRFKTCVMTRKSKSHKDSIECVGNYRRDNTTATNNNKTMNHIAQTAVNNQTQADIFNKLTDGGKLQGLYIQDGKLYINAEFVKIINLIANNITSGQLNSKDGQTYFDLDSGEIKTTGKNIGSLLISGGSLFGYDPPGYLCFSAVCWHDGFRLDFSEGGPTLGSIGIKDGEFIIGCKDDSVFESYTERKIRWKDNGDGTYNLIGRDLT